MAQCGILIRVKSKKYSTLIIIISVLVLGLLIISNRSQGDSSPYSRITKKASPNKNFNKKKYSTSLPGSVWWVVNKKRMLPDGYAPQNIVAPQVALRLDKEDPEMKVRSDIAKNVETMFSDAKKQNIQLLFASGFRSQEMQKQLYQTYVAQDGQEAADRYSAKPGTSEHQTGLAFDVCVVGSECALEVSFAETAASKWVAANAHSYGFIVRYLNGKEAITGYQYEPWHLRYVGVDLAKELYRTNLTMEEFFGL